MRALTPVVRLFKADLLNLRSNEVLAREGIDTGIVQGAILLRSIVAMRY